MRIDLGRLLKGGATVTAVGSALFGATAAGIWWQLFRRPLPKTEGELRVTGLEGEIEISPGGGERGDRCAGIDGRARSRPAAADRVQTALEVPRRRPPWAPRRGRGGWTRTG